MKNWYSVRIASVAIVLAVWFVVMVIFAASIVTGARA